MPRRFPLTVGIVFRGGCQMTRLTASLLVFVLLLSGCGGRGSDSGLNPFGWFGGGGNREQPVSLIPDDGTIVTNLPLGIPQIASARWEPLNEGRLLVATGLAPTKGYHDARLVPMRPQPSDRLSPDPDGVLRLRFAAQPPAPDSQAARLPANPAVDSITVALAISNVELARISRVEISGATNIVSLNR